MRGGCRKEKKVEMIDPKQRKAALLALAMMLLIALPATITLWQVKVAGKLEIPSSAGGFLVVLLFYLWNDELWCSRYNDQNYREGLQRSGRLLRFHKESLAVGVVLIAAAWACKNTLGEAGWPSYLTFLVVVALVPSIGFFAAVRPYINW